MKKIIFSMSESIVAEFLLSENLESIFFLNPTTAFRKSKIKLKKKETLKFQKNQCNFYKIWK